MKNVVEPIKSKKDIEAVEQYLLKRNRRNHLIFIFELTQDSGFQIF